eukprot:4191675-Amphidinium_carterae.1
MLKGNLTFPLRKPPLGKDPQTPKLQKGLEKVLKWSARCQKIVPLPIVEFSLESYARTCAQKKPHTVKVLQAREELDHMDE